MANQGGSERNLGAGIKLILEELRDLRVEMRDLRVEMRADRVRADEDRQRADEDRQRAEEHRQRADEDRRQANERFDQLLREFRDDAARREGTTQRAFKDLRTVGLAIVRTLNHHTRLLERMDRKLGALGNHRRSHGNGGGTHREQ